MIDYIKAKQILEMLNSAAALAGSGFSGIAKPEKNVKYKNRARNKHMGTKIVTTKQLRSEISEETDNDK